MAPVHGDAAQGGEEGGKELVCKQLLFAHEAEGTGAEGSLDHRVPHGDVVGDQKGTALLERLYFSDPERVWDSYPHQLSGGMCQRVAVAMALSNKATLLLADEPTSALDVTSQAEFIRQLREVVDTDGLSVLLVTHNMAVAKALTDRVGVLSGGTLHENGGEHLAHPGSGTAE